MNFFLLLFSDWISLIMIIIGVSVFPQKRRMRKTGLCKLIRVPWLMLSLNRLDVFPWSPVWATAYSNLNLLKICLFHIDVFYLFVFPRIKPRLADPSFKPQKSNILAAVDNFLNVLRIRYSSPLFRLKTANAIQVRSILTALETVVLICSCIFIRWSTIYIWPKRSTIFLVIGN